MLRILGVLALVFVFSVSMVTVNAVSEHSNTSNNGNGHQNQAVNNSSHSNNGNSKKDVSSELEDELDESTQSAKPTCAPEAAWKNHGAYVSCVAHLHLGGQAVSEAARSDIGKKKVASSSGTPKPSSSASSSASPIASSSSSPIASESAITPDLQEELINILANFQSLLERLKHLFGF